MAFMDAKELVGLEEHSKASVFVIQEGDGAGAGEDTGRPGRLPRACAGRAR